MVKDTASWADPVDLWVLSSDTHQPWFPILDWYSNGQIRRGLSHPSREISDELRSLAAEVDFPITVGPVSKSAPLLIMTEGLLPAKRVLVVPKESDPEKWMRHIVSLATGLQAQSLKIFSPKINVKSKLKLDDVMQIDFITEDQWTGV